jgi:hypothetical protein
MNILNHIQSLNHHTLYTIYKDNREQTGTIYEFKNHNNKYFEFKDRDILKNDLINSIVIGPRKFLNLWVCEACKASASFQSYRNVMVNLIEGEINAFCVHSSYIEDELMLFVNDEEDN